MKAIVFSGQGAQYVGMGKSFYDHSQEAKKIFSAVDEIAGLNIKAFCFEGPESELKRTEIQQLAILAVSLSGLEGYKSRFGLGEVRYFSGLSLGEYTCLYASGVLSLEEVIILVRERARAMELASQRNPSSMLAVIGLAEEAVKEKQSVGFYVANINSPNQVVISLSKDKKEEVKQVLKESGAKVMELQVNGGFHSPFMEEAKVNLIDVIDRLHFKDAKIPIVSNVTAQAHSDAGQIKSNLINQLVSCVLWRGCIEYMVGRGVSSFIEIGPSKILTRMIQKIAPDVRVDNIEQNQDLENQRVEVED